MQGKPKGATNRRGVTKSRLGCRTWQRHIKCDETKPNCLKCVKYGWTCDYQQASNAQPSSRPESSVQVSVTSKLPLPGMSATTDILSIRNVNKIIPGPQNNAILDFDGTSEEQKYFQFFLSRTGPGLAGKWGQSFWSILIPQVASSNKSVHHGIAAMAILHEADLLKVGHQSRNWKFFYSQYNKAISHLRDHKSTDLLTMQITLVSCILFTVLEYMRGFPEAGQSHVRGGLKVLVAYKKQLAQTVENKRLSQQIEQLIPDRIVTGFFNNCFVGSITGPSLMGHIVDTYDLLPPGEDQTFSAVTEAHEALFNILGQAVADPNVAFLIDPELQIDNSTRSITLRERLHTWRIEVDIFMANHLPSLKIDDLKAIRLLIIQSILMTIWSKGVVSPKDFDTLRDEFEDIVSQARQIVENQDSSSSSKLLQSFHSQTIGGRSSEIIPKSLPPPKFNTTIIGPLFYVACKCRCPDLRHEAVSLLTRVRPQYDGFRDAGIFAQVASRVIDFEEKGCQLTITKDPSTWPIESKRIHQVYFVPILDPVEKIMTVWYIWQPGGKGTPFKRWQENITW